MFVYITSMLQMSMSVLTSLVLTMVNVSTWMEALDVLVPQDGPIFFAKQVRC